MAPGSVLSLNPGPAGPPELRDSEAARPAAHPAVIYFFAARFVRLRSLGGRADCSEADPRPGHSTPAGSAVNGLARQTATRPISARSGPSSRLVPVDAPQPIADHPLMLTRVLEPEVMDSEEEARQYDEMDHSAVNTSFCDDLMALRPDLDRTLDAGTGTALIPIEICRRSRQARVLGIDLAASMLRIGVRHIERAGLSGAITLEIADAKQLPAPDRSFTTVVSNSIVHHIPEPATVLAELLRVLQPGGWLFVRDLMRPATDAEVKALVDLYAKDATDHQRRLFDASLRAALSLDEIRQCALGLGISEASITATSDRHWTLAHRGIG